MSAVITSRSNPEIKRIRSLRARKERERTGSFWIEGIRLTVEAIELRSPIETVVTASGLLRSETARQAVDDLRGRGGSVLTVSDDVFRSLSDRDGPQGIGAVIGQRWEPLAGVQPGDELCWVVLEEVADPGNLGTVLRTCDAVGAAGLMLIGSTTDAYDPAAVRASMGAILSQRLVRCTVDDLGQWKAQTGLTMVGTSDAASIDYVGVAYKAPSLLAMGSERHGLSAPMTQLCDIVVRLPMVGRSDSLNLSVATGVMLYEMFNQRRSGRAGRGEAPL